MRVKDIATDPAKGRTCTDGGVLSGHNNSVIVIGGSAGAVEALENLVAGLPSDLSSPVLVVVHVPAQARSMLPAILARRGHIPAKHASENDDLVGGQIYVAPPDRHLAVSAGKAHLLTGARINRNRPSIDALFISAARAYGRRVVAVLLSGYLDDGVAGLRAVKDAGGTVIVQDPASTSHPDMPQSAISRVEVDHILEPAEIGKLLARLAAPETPGTTDSAGDVGANADPQFTHHGELLLDNITRSDETPIPQPTQELIAMSCPDCGGVLMGVDVPYPERFRCRVGHAFSLETLLAAKTDEIETALWTAIRALEEKSEMSRSLSVRMRARGAETSSERYVLMSEAMQRDADIVRTLLEGTPRIDGASLA